MNRQPLSIYRTQDIREMDRYAIAELGVGGYALMTRAAQASLGAIRATWPEARKLLVLCGGGNNAGDGYVLARLAVAQGLLVEVCALSNPAKLRNDAGQAWRDFAAHGGQTQSFDGALLLKQDVVVDAVLGTGLSREVEGELAEVITKVNDASVPVASLDVPSGLDSDSGLPRPVAVQADLTVTFIAPKIGLYDGHAAKFCGRIVSDDLALPSSVFERCMPVSALLSEQDVRNRLSPRRRDAHKGQHGRVLIVGGDVGMSGAVVLAAHAALRTGAGTVTVACHPDNRVIVAGQLAELMCVGLTEPSDIEALMSRCDVIAIGPGLGQSEWSERLLSIAIKSGLPLVIDADGLRLLPKLKTVLSGSPRVLTPHPGEAAALLDSTTTQIQASRITAATSIATQYRSAVALKGANTVVADDNGSLAICALGNPGMATAGSGDVLTGIVAGVWAQQTERSAEAGLIAKAAVYIHARAGDLAAVKGERGLMASDIISEIRRCVNFKR